GAGCKDVEARRTRMAAPISFSRRLAAARFRRFGYGSSSVAPGGVEPCYNLVTHGRILVTNNETVEGRIARCETVCTREPNGDSQEHRNAIHAFTRSVDRASRGEPRQSGETPAWSACRPGGEGRRSVLVRRQSTGQRRPIQNPEVRL